MSLVTSVRKNRFNNVKFAVVFINSFINKEAFDECVIKKYLHKLDEYLLLQRNVINGYFCNYNALPRRRYFPFHEKRIVFFILFFIFIFFLRSPAIDIKNFVTFI